MNGKFLLIYWKTGHPAKIIDSWNSRQVAVLEMRRLAQKDFNAKKGTINPIGDHRIVWTSNNKKEKQAYYVRES